MTYDDLKFEILKFLFDTKNMIRLFVHWEGAVVNVKQSLTSGVCQIANHRS